MLNISHIETNNYVNGNGCRYVIWSQGCDFHCQQCWNKYTWSHNSNILKSVDDIFNDIMQTKNIVGVTFSGGEPLLQANELLLLANKIKTETNLGIHIFTGFELYERRTQNQEELLKLADTIVYGRFNNSLPNNNQLVVNNTINKWNYNNSDVEIDINDDLEILFTGYPTDNIIKTTKESI